MPWLVHVYTASGALCAFLAAQATFDANWRRAFLWLSASVVIDSTDGWLARLARVDDRLPHFAGARLDDLVDYLTYVFVPALIVWRAHLVPASWVLPVATAMLLSSAFGFVREDAKTADHFFTGFPSYWNIVVLYLVLLGIPPVYNVMTLLTLAAFVFVRIGYIYPTRTVAWRTVTLCLGALWGAVMLFLIVALPNPPSTVAWLSLSFPVYYIALSVVLHLRRSTVRAKV